MNGQGLHVPGGPQQMRIHQIEEVVTPERLDELLRKQDWGLMAMYQRSDQVFDGEMRLVYVFGKLGH